MKDPLIVFHYLPEYLSKIEMHINSIIGPFIENTFFHPKPWLHVCLIIIIVCSAPEHWANFKCLNKIDFLLFVHSTERANIHRCLCTSSGSKTECAHKVIVSFKKCTRRSEQAYTKTTHVRRYTHTFLLYLRKSFCKLFSFHLHIHLFRTSRSTELQCACTPVETHLWFCIMNWLNTLEAVY